MISTRSLAVPLFWAVFSATLVYGQDLSRYGRFQFGMNLDSLAKQANVKPSEAKMLHQRPAMIQELWWQRPLGSPSPEADPVREVVFSFYNGELFRMVVNYDRYRTEGLTDEDMIGAISAKYGVATRPPAEIVSFSSSRVYNDSEKVLARWEDAQYSFNLFRFAYRPTFGMVLFSKRLDALAQAAVVEAIRLDEQEAPQREIELQKKLDEEPGPLREGHFGEQNDLSLLTMGDPVVISRPRTDNREDRLN